MEENEHGRQERGVGHVRDKASESHRAERGCARRS